jgi:hypothetical protein
MAPVMQADALSKSTRDATTPTPPERRPAPPRAPLRYVPGVGMVDVVQPAGPPLRIKGPPPRPNDRDLDYTTLLRDPNQREQLIKALGLEKPVSPATAVASTSLPGVPPLAPPSVQSAAESTPEVFFAPAAPARMEVLDTASDPTPPPKRSPIEALPTAPHAADERVAVALPKHMPTVDQDPERGCARGGPPPRHEGFALHGVAPCRNQSTGGHAAGFGQRAWRLSIRQDRTHLP